MGREIDIDVNATGRRPTPESADSRRSDSKKAASGRPFGRHVHKHHQLTKLVLANVNGCAA
jgi:hypothetical protein